MSDDLSSAKIPNPSSPKPRNRRRRRKSGAGLGKANSDVFAAVDLGTNNCRLLIAKSTGDGFRVIDSYSKVVRLGAGLSSTGELSQQSMDAAVQAIKVCASKIKHKKVRRWRCIATQACRQASNGDAIMERVKLESGLSFEVISPRVEARLAVMGCLSLADMEKDVALVVDIGGGSSELSWVDIRKIKNADPEGLRARVHRPPISAWASLPVGVVTLSEKFPELGNDELSLATRYQAMKDHVLDLIKEAGCESRFVNAFQNGSGHIIGTSGTITSLAGVHLGLPYYQRERVDGLWMQSAHALSIARRLAALPVDLRAEEPCIGHDRASLLVAGCAIIDVLLEMWPAERIRVADRGLREGILIGLMVQGREKAKAKLKVELPPEEDE